MPFALTRLWRIIRRRHIGLTPDGYPLGPDGRPVPLCACTIPLEVVRPNGEPCAVCAKGQADHEAGDPWEGPGEPDGPDEDMSGEDVAEHIAWLRDVAEIDAPGTLCVCGSRLVHDAASDGFYCLACDDEDAAA